MVLYVLLAIVLIGILVTVHEFGHFLVSRLTGIAVKEFSVGFGPKLYQRTTKKTGMLFTLRAIPVGGYCMYYPDTEESADGKEVDDPRGFAKQAVWKRLLTALAGPAMNFVLAFVAAVAMLLLYYVPVDPFISQVGADSPAYQAGLLPGDEFVRVGDVSVDGAMSVDVMTAIQEAAKDGGTVTLTVRREGEEKTFTVGLNYDEQAQRYLMGISIQGPLPLSQVIPEAFSLLGQGSVAIIDGIKAMFTTKEGLDDTAGIIGVVQMVAVQTQRGGLQMFLYLMVIISINLGLLNLVPIPGLDGSRVIFLIIEAIRRKPVNQKIEAGVHLTGYALLFGLMILLVFKDVGRLFGA